MRTTTAASLAILKVNWERRNLDYLDNFTPFLVSALALGNDDAVSIPDLQDRIKSAHGLTLPLHVLKTLLNRAAKDGFVRRESGVFFRDSSRCTDENFADLRAEVEQGVERLVSALATFASEKCGQQWSASEAEAAIIAFVADEGLETLYASVEGRVIDVPPPSADSSYIVGSFCASVQTTKPELFDDLLTVAKGTLLANALYLPDSSRAAQRFVGTKVYLDTSILVYACGFAGKDREAPARELLTLLRSFGAVLGCFRETVEEVRGILDSCAAMIRTKNLRNSFGPSIEYFVAAGLLSTDIDFMAARCETYIEKLNVQIEDRLCYIFVFRCGPRREISIFTCRVASSW
ncbi:MAG: hypothetical protein Q7S20_02855 [Gemmatimonadaceae bacterium]|nr:hypothetical protein [Gemmatimonadaceae bacterium]